LIPKGTDRAFSKSVKSPEDFHKCYQMQACFDDSQCKRDYNRIRDSIKKKLKDPANGFKQYIAHIHDQACKVGECGSGWESAADKLLDVL